MPSKILREIKPSKPFQTLQQKAFLNLVRTADALTRSSEQLLRPHGLTFTQYNVLRILRGAGEAGASCSQIGERMITTEPDVTRLLDRLERCRWIRRERGTIDRRRVTTRITPQGRKLLKRLDEPVRRLHQRQFATLSRPEIELMIAKLEAVRAGLATPSRRAR
ncbi:MAG TPA: MarR family transcriptional regulator [Terriglobia bacterium]